MIKTYAIKDNLHSDSGGIIVGGKWFKRIKSVKKLVPGRYLVETYYHGSYVVEGGKRMGGTKFDWFVDPTDKSWKKSISVKGIIDALKLIDGM